MSPSRLDDAARQQFTRPASSRRCLTQPSRLLPSKRTMASLGGGRALDVHLVLGLVDFQVADVAIRVGREAGGRQHGRQNHLHRSHGERTSVGWVGRAPTAAAAGFGPVVLLLNLLARTPAASFASGSALARSFAPLQGVSGDRPGQTWPRSVAFFVDTRKGRPKMNLPNLRLEKRVPGFGDFLRRDFLSRDFLGGRRPEKRRDPPMTISAACICEGMRQSIVLAISDRMITYGDTEFEPEQPKITALAPRIVCLFAGHRDFHQMIVSATQQSAAADGVTAVAEAAELYASHYIVLRRRRAEQKYLAPLGLTTETYLSRQRGWPPNWSRHSRGECWTRRWG